MNIQEPLLTTEDVANYLKVEVVTVRRLVGRGELAAYRVGGEYRFAPADIQDYLRRQYLPARPINAPGMPLGEPGTLWLSALYRSSQSQTLTRTVTRGPAAASFGERFTKHAQAALSLTQSRAEQLGSAGIVPVHLLLGLAAEPDGVAGKALAEFGVTEAHIQGVLADNQDLLGPARTGSDVHLALAPDTMRALRSAVEQAHKLKHNYVGTEHLLLGLLADAGNSAMTVLANLKIKPDKLRAHIKGLIPPSARAS